MVITCLLLPLCSYTWPADCVRARLPGGHRQAQPLCQHAGARAHDTWQGVGLITTKDTKSYHGCLVNDVHIAFVTEPTGEDV